MKYFSKITNPAEINDNNINIPIFGVTPDLDDIDDERSFKIALESAVVNIKTNLNNKIDDDKCRTILITSPTASNGKTTISRGLAMQLKNLTHKNILMIDGDFKRGNQHKFFNKKTISTKEFLNIDDTNLNNYKIEDGFYLIPKIRDSKNTFQFLYSQDFIDKLEYLKSKFGYILIDTAPLLGITDILFY